MGNRPFLPCGFVPWTSLIDAAGLPQKTRPCFTANTRKLRLLAGAEIEALSYQ
jgi:hypothetical protein